MRKLHPVTRTLVACFVASLCAGAAVIIVFGDFRPLVRESVVVSFFYSISIALVTQALAPAVVRWAGKPGWKLTMGLSLALVVSGAVGSLAGSVLLLAIGLGTPAQFWENYFFLMRIAAALSVVSGLASHFYERLTSQLKETQFERERALKVALEAKLSSLESRIHPHFLFNTLNSISALIAVDPKRAEEMIERLATLLRSSLNSTQQALIPLESELAIVQDYLEIEKAKLGDRLEYSFNVSSEAGRILVPPFSVQSLAENSVKYGIAPQEEGGRIEVIAKREAELLRLEITDTGPGFDLSSVNPGHGLDTLISRLETFFGSAARLEVGRRGQYCVVSLWIPA